MNTPTTTLSDTMARRSKKAKPAVGQMAKIQIYLFIVNANASLFFRI